MKKNQHNKSINQLQQLASNPNNSCWVFASAGSGKTTILTNRVLRLLLEKTDPGKILCLTFTNAGASEMQNRINKELTSWSSLKEEELQTKLENLTGQIVSKKTLENARSLLFYLIDNENKIKVQTIHSFCQGLMKIFPFEANISPTFEILEETQEKSILQDAINLIFKKAQTNSQIHNLITYISSKVSEENLSELLFKIIDKKGNLININEHNLEREFLSFFDISEDVSEMDIFNKLLENIQNPQVKRIFNALEKSSPKTNNKLATSYYEILQEPNIDQVTKIKSIFFTNEGKLRKLYSDLAKDEQLLNEFEFISQIVLKYIDKINSAIIAKDSSHLLKLTLSILKEYNILKKQTSKVDYNDLITLTNKLLNNPEFRDWIKMKMDSTFDHILVDESQDTNHQQWNIIKALSEDFFSGESKSKNNRSIFIVGDEKQSIYSFQGADAGISTNIYKYFKKRLGDKLLNIKLNNSFRSKKEILDFVDNVFSEPSRANSISKTNEYQNHNAVKEGTGKIEIWPQITKETKKEEKSYEWQLDFTNQHIDKTPAEIMAEMVAKKIKNKIDNEGAKFDDFMILLRNRTGDFDKFLNIYLNKYDIKFISPKKINLKHNLLINDLINIAKFCCLKEDDLTLAAILKSPFFKYGEEELLTICHYKNKHQINLFDSLKNTKPQDYETLNEIYQISQNINPLEFYYHLLYQKDYYKNFVACFGKNCQAILNSFLKFVEDFEKSGPNSLQIFLEYIEKFDHEISPITNTQNQVLISTIHSAKGLQSKIVFMPDCCYNFNQLLTSKENIFWHNNLPIWCAKKDNENEFIKYLKEEKIKLAKEEYLRLLYVGLTRAEEELYIGGFGNAKDPENWYEITKNSNPEYLVVPTELEEPEVAENKSTHFVNYQHNDPIKANQVDNSINTGQLSGNLVHKVLELIGNNYQQDKEILANLSAALIDNDKSLNNDKQTEIKNKIHNFINSKLFDQLFLNNNSAEILCESAISADKKTYRIDLLIKKENEIFIIDYKSDEPDQQKREEYKAQLLRYQYAIRNIYPTHAIKTAIIWINEPRIDWC
ncbi:MAG: UvrD-helicase domain-containing protein [Rickettsiales bacterium]|nr:UvrD-helicase domain-containing protein [Rickettsiales bacterium]